MHGETLLPAVVGESASGLLAPGSLVDIVVGVAVALGLFLLYYRLILLRAKRGPSRDRSQDNRSGRDTGN